MKPYIFQAENSIQMDEIAKSLKNKGFKLISNDDNYLVLKKRSFGSIIFHFIFLVLILFGSPSFFSSAFVSIPFIKAIFDSTIFVNGYYFIFCALYIGYVFYYLFTKTIMVIVTTETVDNEGNPLEFNNINDLNLK
ncbi:hypothetical protein [Methanobrevibacter curvatus]|uniref:Uncharacterized protein n=1 Tax=Methanobrevibacter curvatus TaxID=49547 RepID=A0A165Z931_9EURY|nr:hypothetical protein [Methanobrevibacter curvatus]KZX10413.1 hypothetical protein MBCUR_17830 [Methanobrevibacter curvatus]